MTTKTVMTTRCKGDVYIYVTYEDKVSTSSVGGDTDNDDDDDDDVRCKRNLYS